MKLAQVKDVIDAAHRVVGPDADAELDHVRGDATLYLTTPARLTRVQVEQLAKVGWVHDEGCVVSTLLKHTL